MLSSAQNIDRLVTVYRATIKAQRRLADRPLHGRGRRLDRSDHHPAGQPGLAIRSRSTCPLRQRVRVKESGQFHRTAAVKPYRVFDEDLSEALGSFVLFGAFQGHVPHLLKAGLLKGGAVVWSMWDGYLTGQRGERFVTSLQERRDPADPAPHIGPRKRRRTLPVSPRP